MDTWSPFQVILALLAAIFIPGILVHFTLGRNSGHHLFDESLSKEEIKNLPFSMLSFRIRNNLIGSLAVLIGGAGVIFILNTICGALGIETSRDLWIAVATLSFFALVIIRLALLRKKI
jgi:hypothetical protein